MHVLLVETHQDNATSVAAFFTERGHTVELAVGGEAALRRLAAGGCDVLIHDVDLPDINGLALCRRIREEFRSPIPVVMLSTRDQVADRVAGFGAGADDYLVRPFSLLELDARIGAIVRRATPSSMPWVANAPLQVADLIYDPNTLTAQRDGITLKLNPSTRRLLVLLMHNTHRVVTRQELEQELWGGQPPDGDVLRAHMYALRNAVDKPFDRKLLHTHHGEGYRLAPRES
jgi:DNA-binding response OmpR family regulator